MPKFRTQIANDKNAAAAAKARKPQPVAAASSTPREAAAKPRTTSGSAAGASQSFKSALAKMSGLMNKAKTHIPTGGINVPAGRYDVKINEHTISAKNGSLRRGWKAEVLDGEYAGKTLSWSRPLTGEDDFSYHLADIGKFGYEVETLEPADLEDIAKEITEAGREARISVVESGEYTNVYINSVVLETEDTDGDAVGGKGEVGGEESEDAEETTEEVSEDAEDDTTVEEVEDEEAPAEEPEEEGSELKVGDKIAFKDGKKKLTGTVKKIKGDDIFVQVPKESQQRTITIDVIESILE